MERELRELRRLVRTIVVMAPAVSFSGKTAGPPLEPERLLALLDDFKRFLEVDLSLDNLTVRSHLINMRAFLRWCISEGRRVDRETLRDFLSLYRSENTRANYVKAFKRFFRDFLDRGDMVASLRVPKPRIQIQPRLDLPSKEEMRQFFNALNSIKYKAMFLLYASSGLRLRELVYLRFKDVNFRKRMINVSKAHRGKTKRGWITFYSKEAQEILNEYLKTLPPEEKTPEKRIFDIVPYSVERAFRKASKKSGIKITPQTLREWFCETLAQAGIPERYIDAFCGRIPATTLRLHYSDYRPEKLEQVYRKAEPALRILS